MKVKTVDVSISKESVVGGLKSWKKYTLSAELEDGDAVEDVKAVLEEQIMSWHEQPSQADSPNWHPLGGTPYFNQLVGLEKHGEMGEAPKPKTQKEKIKEQILQASDMMVLNSFELLCKKDPELKEAYDIRFNQLKN